MSVLWYMSHHCIVIIIHGNFILYFQKEVDTWFVCFTFNLLIQSRRRIQLLMLKSIFFNYCREDTPTISRIFFNLLLITFGKCSYLKNKKNSTPMGFEPTRAEPIGLAVQRLNHSATASYINPNSKFESKRIK